MISASGQERDDEERLGKSRVGPEERTITKFVVISATIKTISSELLEEE